MYFRVVCGSVGHVMFISMQVGRPTCILMNITWPNDPQTTRNHDYGKYLRFNL